MPGGVLVGTYGGGLTRRTGDLTDKGDWRPFPETAGLKVNTGCLVVANGRVYVGNENGDVYALRAKNGREVWRTRLGAGVFGGPSVAIDTISTSVRRPSGSTEAV